MPRPTVFCKKPMLQATFIVVMLAFSAGCSHDPASDLKARAELADQSGDLLTAAALYAEAAARSPEEAQLQWHLARTLLKLREGSRAEAAIRASALLGIEPNRTRPALAQALFLQTRYGDLLALTTQDLDKSAAARVLALQSRASLATGQVEQAGSLIADAQAEAPYVPEVLIAEADQAMQGGDLHSALNKLHELETIEPDYLYTPGMLAEIALARGDLQGAETHFSHAVDLRFDFWQERLKRGQVRLLLGDTAGALEDVDALLSTDRIHDDVLILAYQARLAEGKPEVARETLESLRAKNPDNAEASYLLARLALHEHRPEDARRLARTALSLAPGHRETRKLIAAMALREGDPRTAEKVIRPAATSHADDIEASRILAASLLAQERYREMVDPVQMLIDASPADTARELQAGQELLSDERFDEASAHLAKLVSVDPSDLSGPGFRRIHVQTPPKNAVDSGADVIDRFLADAQDHLNQGDQAAARLSVEQALRADPLHDGALEYLVGLSLLSHGEIDAVPALSHALEAKPDRPALWLWRADLAESERDWTSFENALKRGLALRPRDDLTRARLALHFLERQQSPDEAALLLAGYENSPTPELQVALAETYYAQHRIDRALPLFKQLLREAPYTGLYLRLAAIYEVRGNTGAARTMLERIVELAPQDDHAILAQARLAALGGQTWEARRLIEACGLAPDHPEVLRSRFYVASVEGQPEHGRELAQRLWKNERSLAALLNFTRTLDGLEEHGQAIELLEDWRTAHPQDLLALRDLVTLYAADGREDDKLATLEQIVALDPDDAVALNNLAWALQDRDPGRASDFARRATLLHPDSTEFSHTLAVVLAKNRQYGDAIALASHAVETSEHHATPRLRRAEILLIAGRVDEAMEDLKTIRPADISLPDRERRMHLLTALVN